MKKGSVSIGLTIGERFLIWRWWWITLASLIIFVFEYLEYQPFLRGFDERFFFEILAYGIILPLSTGLAFTWLAASRSELAWTTYYRDLKRNLDVQLNNATSYKELADVFMLFVRVVMPLIGAALYRYDQDSQNYKMIATWALNKDASVPDSLTELDSKKIPCPATDAGNDEMVLRPCNNPNIPGYLKESSCFCIPFLFSQIQIGCARLYFPSGSTPSFEQARLLNEIAPDIASAFQRIKLESLIKLRNDNLNADQQRLARDVHDTLGHSLAYLRLRLDQISMEFNQTEMNTLRREVELLRDVAKDAYNQMRDVLNELSPASASNLNNTLLNYADKISQRASFELDIHCQGHPLTFSPLTRRNIFYIFQEALANIEKHAHAKRVGVDVKWQETDLEIVVVDDGVGFDPDTSIANGHFGISNMRERALESNGRLLLSSQPGYGTRLILRIPAEDLS